MKLLDRIATRPPATPLPEPSGRVPEFEAWIVSDVGRAVANVITSEESSK